MAPRNLPATRLSLCACVILVACTPLDAGEDDAVSPGVRDPDFPRPEHPRPDFRRAKWHSLNGGWLFRADPEDRGLAEGWERDFEFERDVRDYEGTVVPFPWESAAAVTRMSYTGVAWYRRLFETPAGFEGERVWVVFGAVDHEATAWLNGERLGGHEGGYTPFACEVTGKLLAVGNNDLAVRVVDATDPETPTGTQGLFTPSSGIWQTVYLEARPPTRLAGMRITPSLDPPGAEFELDIQHEGPAAAAELAVRFEDPTVPAVTEDRTLEEGITTVTLHAAIGEPRPWEPGSPHLYEAVVSVRVGERADEVSTAFGLREIATGRAGESGVPRLLLNGRPIYLAGALHHGLDPWGLSAHPSDDAIRGDVERVLASGFNAVRVHSRVDDPRFYHWCDRLGCLVIYDLPGFARFTERSRRLWEATAREAIARDFNHPSIIAWTLFADTRGLGEGGYARDRQEWVRSMVRMVRELDPTRIVDDNSSIGRDHVETDLDTWHFLDDGSDAATARARIASEIERHVPGSTFNFIGGNVLGEQPLVAGSFGVPTYARGDQDVSLAFLTLTSLLRREERVSGSIWRDLTDAEWVQRGLFDYDRAPKEFGFGELTPGVSLADLNEQDVVGFDSSLVTAAPGDTLELAVFVSHFSRREVAAEHLVVELTLHAVDRLGEQISAPLGEFPARWRPYGVVRLDPVRVTLPAARPLAGAIGATLKRADTDEPLARNLLLVVARDAPAPRVEVAGRRVWLRFEPVEYADADTLPLRDLRRSLLRLPGIPSLEYRVEVPAFVPLGSVRRIGFVAELAAVGDASRLDWPRVRRRNDHPQTGARKSPSTVAVTIAGGAAGSFDLLDAPSDLRGLVSYASGYPNGIHGTLVRAWREAPRLDSRRVSVRLEAAPGAAGLAVFGERMGRYVIDPAVVLELDREVPAPADAASLTAARDVFGESTRSLLPTAGERRVEWLFTTRTPPGDWTAPDFDDAPWSRGAAPFGTEAAGAGGTAWRSTDIWLRARFEAAAADLGRPLFLRLRHGERVEVSLNGREILHADGVLSTYATLPLPTSVRESLFEGVNIIAVHCRHAAGERAVDVGLLVEER